MTAPKIDLNADVGESPSVLADGSEAQLVAAVTSINVACGGHAGDVASMTALVRLARDAQVALGAHPAYPDRDGFGRRTLAMAPEALAQSIASQVAALESIAAAHAVPLVHIKPHGALYNEAARDAAVASTITSALVPWRERVTLVGLAGSVMLDVFRAAGFAVAAEAFADRRYEPDGTLRARRYPDAVLTDPTAVAAQVLAIALGQGVVASDGSRLQIAADTLCVHGDTPGAAALVTHVRARLLAAGIRVEPL